MTHPSKEISPFTHIRDFVTRSVSRRDQLAVRPSDYWREFIRLFSYVRTLPDDEMERIRHHTYHLTGDNYQRYYFGNAREASLFVEELDWLSIRLGGFVYLEKSDGLGYPTRDGKISVDLLRYLNVTQELHEAGLLDRARPIRVLEIGGGYGGLAACILAFNPHVTYLIVDLEETLFFSGTYLTHVLGAERVHLLDPESPLLALTPGHVHLLPQSGKSILSRTRFDLVINQQSMQEMREDQVQEYIRMIADCAEHFYSCNYDQHAESLRDRTGIVANLNHLLESAFGTPLREWKNRTRIASLAAHVACRSLPLRRFYCTAFGEPARRNADIGIRRAVYRIREHPAAVRSQSCA